MKRELQAGGYLRYTQAKAPKGQFAQGQYHLFEAPSEDRGDESHDDRSQPWITAGISRATWFRQKTGNPSAASIRTATPKQTSGETQRGTGISGNGEARNRCATDSLTGSPKRRSGETQREAERVSHHETGNPCATDSLNATPLSAGRVTRRPDNGIRNLPQQSAHRAIEGVVEHRVQAQLPADLRSAPTRPTEPRPGIGRSRAPACHQPALLPSGLAGVIS